MNEELANGYFASPADFARKARAWAQAQGASRWWCALEWNDPSFGNDTRGPAVKQAVEAEAGVFTIWLTRPFTAAEARQAVVESRCAGFIAEAEIPGHRPEAQNWPELIWALRDLPVPKGVATNFAPFVHEDGSPWPEKAAPLVDGGWHCLTEAYDMGGPVELWPDLRHSFAQHLGWSETQPILGTYGGRTLDDFPSRHGFPNWSVWDAGSVL